MTQGDVNKQCARSDPVKPFPSVITFSDRTLQRVFSSLMYLTEVCSCVFLCG